MGKTIILAGAPDAASLDWSTVEETAVPETVRPWEAGIHTTDVGPHSHPEWRVVPAHVPGAAPPERPQTRPALETAQPRLKTEQNEQPQATNDSVWHLYGRAAFLDLTQVTQESTQPSTQDDTRDTGSRAPSSLDEASLSFRLPNALPPTSPQPPPMPSLPPLPSRPPQTATFVLSQEFIEHSLAVHDALPSSLPAFEPPAVYETAASFDETTMSLSLSQPEPLSFSASRLPPLPADIPRWQPLTHLADVPSAAYLRRMAPQTVTVNLVVAIVSVGVPRVVGNTTNSRRRDRPPTSLVELVVGDETRSGFGMTVWMDGAQSAGPSSLAMLLPTLAPHDVVLLRHVALHVFGDKVYGSSLRKDQTKMHILHRGGLLQPEPAHDALFSSAHLAAAAQVPTSTQAGASYPADLQLLAKTARVRNWALRFVIVDPVGVCDHGDEGDDSSANLGPAGDKGPRPQQRLAWMMPPADTQ
ncbi:hypothetical protein HMPREF1624_02343 [Sporothrix schenckii ATCC 58251]|uniref:Uncharacterized protein n=1 Tax=Sporothrix schenckii (strain ATCC 58251 / de Perez 2211183) TaxID=1391915 RepID=U7PZM7_SPOS1|nr:hypothetical protein HMPREF1624_02343 [Sporothrix schenckii ATCC 58251]